MSKIQETDRLAGEIRKWEGKIGAYTMAEHIIKMGYRDLRVSRQQMLKEVLEVVEGLSIQQAGGELDDVVCISDIKHALKERFCASDEA